jgi:hypothetical protein
VKVGMTLRFDSFRAITAGQLEALVRQRHPDGIPGAAELREAEKAAPEALTNGTISSHRPRGLRGARTLRQTPRTRDVLRVVPNCWCRASRVAGLVARGHLETRALQCQFEAGNRASQ